MTDELKIKLPDPQRTYDAVMQQSAKLMNMCRCGRTMQKVDGSKVGVFTGALRTPTDTYCPECDEAPRPHVVVFKDVRKTYNEGSPNEYTAIDKVNFTVADIPKIGEFVCVLGPSGCGKSTILRLIAGLQPQFPATQGEVLVFGKPVIGPGADRGMVFQDYTAFDQRSVLGNVAYGLECQGYNRSDRLELARYWIDQVGLNVKKDQHKYPHELSGGMRQRVAIARTLILKPRIILMDEPFGALDPNIRREVQDLLVKLWREVEATVFFVTHSIEEAVFLGDRVYIMSAGPGTIVKELQIEPADRPALEMSRVPRFRDTVYEISEMIAKMDTGVK